MGAYQEMKLSARALSRKLTGIDIRINKMINTGNFDYEPLDAEKAKLMKEAVKKGLKIIAVPVADGEAFYYEDKRTTRMVTFEWFYGGADGYLSGFGKTVIIPLTTANKLIKKFKPEHY